MKNATETWVKDRASVIVKRLRKSDVFRAVGDELKYAMIAAEVMSILSQMADFNITIQRFDELQTLVRKTLLGE